MFFWSDPKPKTDVFSVGSKAGSGSGCFKESEAESDVFWSDSKPNPGVFFLVGSKDEFGCFFGRIRSRIRMFFRSDPDLVVLKNQMPNTDVFGRNRSRIRVFFLVGSKTKSGC